MFIKKYLQVWLLAFITTISLLVLDFSNPEWYLIYTHLNLTPENNKIISPITTSKIIIYENTFGAERGGNRRHLGIDVFAPIFTPVVNVINGVVLKTGSDILGGNIVKILGEDNRIYYYAHLQSYLNYNAGDQIKQGEKIGYIGNSGNAFFTPSHLHFEIIELEWYFPLVSRNINPYYELIESASVNENLLKK